VYKKRTVSKKKKKIARAIRPPCTGDRRGSTAAASITLGEEVGIPPLCAIATAERVRAYAKAHESRTVLGCLVRHKAVGAMLGGWVSLTGIGITRLLNREPVRGPGGVVIPHATLLNREGARVLRKWALHVVWEGQRLLGLQTVSYADYSNTARAATRRYSSLRTVPIPLQRTLHWLTRLRVGAFYTQARLRHTPWALPAHGQCAFCGDDAGEETVAHMIVACGAWHGHRERLLGGMIAHIRGFLSEEFGQERDKGVASFLLGGRRFSAQVDADAGQVALVIDRGAAWVQAWTGRAPPAPPAPGVAEGPGAHPLGNVLNGDGSVNLELTHRPFLRVATFLSTVVPLREARIVMMHADAAEDEDQW